MKPNYKRFGWLVQQIFQAIGTDDDPDLETLRKIQRAADECGVDLSRDSSDD